MESQNEISPEMRVAQVPETIKTNNQGETLGRSTYSTGFDDLLKGLTPPPNPTSQEEKVTPESSPDYYNSQSEKYDYENDQNDFNKANEYKDQDDEYLRENEERSISDDKVDQNDSLNQSDSSENKYSDDRKPEESNSIKEKEDDSAEQKVAQQAEDSQENDAVDESQKATNEIQETGKDELNEKLEEVKKVLEEKFGPILNQLNDRLKEALSGFLKEFETLNTESLNDQQTINLLDKWLSSKEVKNLFETLNDVFKNFKEFDFSQFGLDDKEVNMDAFLKELSKEMPDSPVKSLVDHFRTYLQNTNLQNVGGEEASEFSLKEWLQEAKVDLFQKLKELQLGNNKNNVESDNIEEFLKTQVEKLLKPNQLQDRIQANIELDKEIDSEKSSTIFSFKNTGASEKAFENIIVGKNEFRLKVESDGSIHGRFSEAQMLNDSSVQEIKDSAYIKSDLSTSALNQSESSGASLSQQENGSLLKEDSFAQMKPQLVPQKGAQDNGAGEVKEAGKFQNYLTRVFESERQIVDRIISQVKLKIRDGGKEIRFDLNPPELGKVRVVINENAGALQSKIIVDSYAIKDVVESNIGQLKQALSGQLKVDKLDVEVREDSPDRQQFMSKEKGDFSGREEKNYPGDEASFPYEYAARAEHIMKDSVGRDGLSQGIVLNEYGLKRVDVIG